MARRDLTFCVFVSSTFSDLIVERLAAADPSNACWQRDVWVSCWKTADALERSGDARAVDRWHRTYAKLSALKQCGRFVFPQDEQFLEKLRLKLNR
jgi:hypothetical protein